jgi:DNA-binding NarL/FixJ family response regulator
MDDIKVAIADDHKIFRKGVILSLRQYTNIKFILEAENGEELLKGLTGTRRCATRRASSWTFECH